MIRRAGTVAALLPALVAAAFAAAAGADQADTTSVPTFARPRVAAPT